MLAHSMSNENLSISPDSCNATLVGGSPMISLVPLGTEVGSGASAASATAEFCCPPPPAHPVRAASRSTASVGLRRDETGIRHDLSHAKLQILDEGERALRRTVGDVGLRVVAAGQVEAHGLGPARPGGQVDAAAPAAQRLPLQLAHDEAAESFAAVARVRPDALELGGRRVVAAERAAGHGLAAGHTIRNAP